MYKVGSWLLLGLLRLLGLLPLRVHYALGRFVTWLLQYVVGYRRDEVMHNLTKAFPDEKVWDLRVVRKEFYRHLGEVIAETVWFGACRGPKRLHRQRLVEIDNPELVATYREASPGMVILAGHTGNWEIIGGIAAYNYSDIPSPLSEENYCVVYRALSSRVWGEIMRDNRTAPLHDRKAYEGYLESKELIRYAFKHAGEKKAYGILIDQRPYFHSPADIEVDFMGQRVKTMTGGAALARKFNMAVLYQTARRDRRGHYTLHYTPICGDASKMSVEEIMKKYYALLESDIREQPANYLWSHKRFV
ncbi:Lauroyl/myristoyl acyltransferase [Bacteroidales bacterium WCE2004]|jgi:KDO2-lipid IV(A) lauroyltransferase|nr:lysophospholipid acyltransferase family protein [Bacteroidales bacterium]SKC38972.1 Lauroyl/myristoyl acyltransferase [Bacteroidales bacterium WCE2004]